MTENSDTIAKTGITGLDNVLGGGLVRRRLYLLQGDPGTGKTTIALQFLLAGARLGEKTLYVSMSETAEELTATATSHGWNLGDIEIFEMITPEDLLDRDQQQSLLYSSDLELGEATKAIFERARALQPQRVVIDSLSEFQLLAQGSVRYRRQLLSMKHFFARQGATVLVIDDLTAESKDRTIHSIAHGVIHLVETAPDYGAERRRLRIVKYRGMRFRGGFHDFTLETGGARVYPRLIAGEHRRSFDTGILTSNVEALDLLLGGGFDRGSSMLLIGPAGAGKSLIALQFAKAALNRGEKVAAYIFDEEIGLLKRRMKGMGFDLQHYIDRGDLILEPVDAAELAPGEFAHRVRDRVVQDGVGTIIIDSLNGYQQAMPQEQFLVLHMHELLTFLNRQGVCSIVTVAQHGMLGDNMKAPIDVTYISDTVILLRFFEAQGRVLRAISVVKKRIGSHENTIREYMIGSEGLSVGEPLTQFQGVLRGTPVYQGERSGLIDKS